MGSRAERREALASLLAANGETLDTSDEGLARLDTWFCANVQGSADVAGQMQSEWFAVTLDIGLVLGDAMIERHPGLHWAFYTRVKKDLSYQRPVVAGFAEPFVVANRDYHVDPEISVVTHGNRVICDLPEPRDLFRQMVAMEHLTPR